MYLLKRNYHHIVQARHEAKASFCQKSKQLFGVLDLGTFRWKAFASDFTAILVKGEELIPMVCGVGLYGNMPLNTQNITYSSNIYDMKVILQGVVFHYKFHLVHHTFTMNGEAFKNIKMKS
jgi:hypothetical protein